MMADHGRPSFSRPPRLPWQRRHRHGREFTPGRGVVCGRITVGGERLGTIFKICRASEWAQAEQSGTFAGSPIDLRDGYIHFSTAEQVVATAVTHFAGVDGLILAAVDADALGDALRWEPARGGALFPHLYGRLAIADVLWVRALPLDEAGRHVFPDLQTGRPT
jgi:uncharacterized protein (DUF952 family)